MIYRRMGRININLDPHAAKSGDYPVPPVLLLEPPGFWREACDFEDDEDPNFFSVLKIIWLAPESGSMKP